MHHRAHRPPENRFAAAHHTHIAQERRAAGVNDFISRGYVRVRAHYGTYASVQIPAHGHFLTRRFRMYVDDDRARARRHCGNSGIRGLERAIRHRIHEHTPQERQHTDRAAARQREHVIASAGLTRTHIRRPQNMRQMGQLSIEPALVPHVIAPREHVNPGIPHLVDTLPGQTAATRHVLAVGYTETAAVLVAESGYQVDHGAPPTLADNVTNEQNFHADSQRPERRRATAEAEFETHNRKSINIAPHSAFSRRKCGAEARLCRTLRQLRKGLTRVPWSGPARPTPASDRQSLGM